MTLKRLLRESRPRQDNNNPTEKPAIHMPLTADSSVMQAFVERCLHMAKNGYFLLIYGHPGDLIEAPSLFQHLIGVLNLQHPIIASSGNERSIILDAKTKAVDAILVPCATQIPQGTQEFMAEGNLNHLRLVLLCYPMHKHMNLESLVRPSLKRKSIGMLRYPEWNTRKDDQVNCILAAAEIAEKQFNCKLDFDKDNLHSFHEKDWKSIGHMLVAMMDFAKQKSQLENFASITVIRM